MTDLIAIYGTDEPPVPRHPLRAGPLTAHLEAGQLRDIRWHGALVLRAISYLLRDANWGTLAPVLSDLTIRETSDAFLVAYRATVPGLTYEARIEGRASGALHFAGTARASADFLTNRTGFVVLHPDTAAGNTLTITHTDGRVEDTAFPARILPDQPAFDIAALTHHPAPGLTARTTFKGGVFEMEDQRNWADASFKTYIRPVAWPRPYTIGKGSEDTQSVHLALAGTPAPVPARPARSETLGTMPPLWLRLDAGLPVPDRLCLPGLAHGLILRAAALPDAQRLSLAAALATREGMALAVEVVLPAREAEREAEDLARALDGVAPELLFVSLARDGKTRQSGSLPPGEATFDRMAAALHAALPGQAFAFGTPAFFTEFNRNPPPPAEAAFFGVAGTVHAADDASVIETLGVLPEIARSASLRCPGARLIPGPLTIAPTVSPYAPSLTRTDGTTRSCMAPIDPRHSALFGAAHLAGTVAALAPQVAGLAPAFAEGPAGLGSPAGKPFPLAHLHATLAAASGRTIHKATLTATWAELAWEGGRIAANLSPDPMPVPAGHSYSHCLGTNGWMPWRDGSDLGPFACVWSHQG